MDGEGGVYDRAPWLLSAVPDLRAAVRAEAAPVFHSPVHTWLFAEMLEIIFLHLACRSFRMLCEKVS